MRKFQNLSEIPWGFFKIQTKKIGAALFKNRLFDWILNELNSFKIKWKQIFKITRLKKRNNRYWIGIYLNPFIKIGIQKLKKQQSTCKNRVFARFEKKHTP